MAEISRLLALVVTPLTPHCSSEFAEGLTRATTCRRTLHTAEVTPFQGCPRFKFIFSAHMNAMELPLLVGTKEMCMFHEPAGFWPNIFLNIFWELSKVTVLYL